VVQYFSLKEPGSFQIGGIWTCFR